MYCAQCGWKMEDEDAFCRMCGAARADMSAGAFPPPETSTQVDAPPPVDERAPAVPPAEALGPGTEPHAASHDVQGRASGSHADKVTDAGKPASKPKTVVIVAAAAVIVAAVVAGVFVLGAPAGPDSPSAGGDPSSAVSSSAAEPSSSTGSAEGASPSSADSQPAKQEPSADRIQADGFSFELPEYWKGKVLSGKIDGGVAIYPDTAFGAVEGYELAWLTLVPDEGPAYGGDYMTHSAGLVRGDGMRVQVVSRNWAAFYGGDWYRHPNYAGSSLEQQLAAALIDLSSGGAFSYDDVRSVAQSAASDADAYSPFLSVDVDFLNETLIPTVKIDGSDTMSSGNVATANLSDEDRESIAEAFGMEMFTSAENTGDGAMRWIGCDHALEAVVPGSSAESCDFWAQTESGGYLRIATDAAASPAAGDRHYRVQVTYEAALDAMGVNRRANIATVEIWLAESGEVEDIEVIRQS